MLRISVATSVQEVLLRQLAKAGSRECGGILLGEHVGVNHFRVLELTAQRPGSFGHFVRRLSGVANAIRAFSASRGSDFTRFNYLGEWHSHPLFTVNPSSTDHASMREIALDPRVGANFVVLLIFRLKGKSLEGSAHTYLPDGSVHLSQLELEEVR
jgi:proteasome lid subunit RPN8/RPN11